MFIAIDTKEEEDNYKTKIVDHKRESITGSLEKSLLLSLNT
jgi:hypothetical protein